MTPCPTRRSVVYRIAGAVQGVGFRPFVFRLAQELQLNGWIRNDSDGVEVHAAGEDLVLDQFRRRILAEAPPAARIASIGVTEQSPEETRPVGFSIRESRVTSGGHTAVMADLATCPDCLRELFDPANRRYRYPFTNCTHCGPRFSIITAIPYDRPNTTMADFILCPRCQSEYDHPADRRFHAQPNACPVCGPSLVALDRTGQTLATEDAGLRLAEKLLREGGIVALKGIGGFHLLADARNEKTVLELRRRKHRLAKPLAVMFPSLSAIERECHASDAERALLRTPVAPIVLLRKRAEFSLAPALSPDRPTLGALLPYSPLHHLLLADIGFPVVATSGNLAEDPICFEEAQALERLAGIADLFLSHNRPIVRPVDDSVLCMAAGRPLMLRRSRGLAPLPLQDPGTRGPTFGIESRAVLAVGGHLKNAVALAAGGELHLGPHVGDLGSEASRRAFEHAAVSLPALFDTTPHVMACDQHPDYASTAFAHAQHVRSFAVQHHHAHVLAVMAEHGLRGDVLGIALDGTGWGPDGTVWGGEFLIANAHTYRRVAHLRTFPLPGGDAAVCEPRRAALGLLYEAFGPAVFTREDITLRRLFTDTEWATLRGMLDRGIHCPRTSSAGRLFDAVAALMGLASLSAYEGQAASHLEYAAAADRTSALPLRLLDDGTIDWEPMLPALLDFLPAVGIGDRAEFQSLEARISLTAAAFHNALAGMMVEVARRANLPRVVLGGGCFQNVRLLETAVELLRAAGFEVFWPRETPPNDGGLALGQAWAALHAEGTTS